MALTATVIAAVVIGALYWAQAVFIPVAVAIFLTFLLSPLVRLLQHVGLGRGPAAIVAVSASALLLGGLIWLVAWNMTGLLQELPKYSANIRNKAQSLGAGAQHLEKIIEEITEEFKTKPAAK